MYSEYCGDWTKALLLQNIVEEARTDRICTVAASVVQSFHANYIARIGRQDDFEWIASNPSSWMEDNGRVAKQN
jgi:hypothetical protein